MRKLERKRFSVKALHGGYDQAARFRVMTAFRTGEVKALVATDVASRGLDVAHVTHVVNLGLPREFSDYTHRIGRTGRAGKSGLSHTFFQPGDKSHAGELQQVMRQAGQEVPEDLMKFGSTIKKKEHKLYGNFGPKDGPMKKATKITFDYSDDE